MSFCLHKRVYKGLCSGLFLLFLGLLLVSCGSRGDRIRLLEESGAEATSESLGSTTVAGSATEEGSAAGTGADGSGLTYGELRSAESENGTDPGSVDPASADPEESPELVYMAYVCGCVQRPGVYPFAPGARVGELIESAGGFTEDADTAYYNLARTVPDEAYIRVPSKEETAGQGALLSLPGEDTLRGTGIQGEDGSFGEETPGDTPVDINRAGAAELASLPGIGLKLAERILEDRRLNGFYKDPGELIRVKGIGEKLLASLMEQIIALP